MNIAFTIEALPPARLSVHMMLVIDMILQMKVNSSVTYPSIWARRA